MPGIPEGAYLLAQAGLKSGGGATKVLEALEESSFVSRTVPFGKKTRDSVYRLIDEYSLFYLTWVRSAPNSVFASAPGGYWLQTYRSPRWSSWAGYAFEGVCQKHILQLKHALGISGIHTTDTSWSIRPERADGRGAEIDLLIDRADNCITLCEMKFSGSEFVIDKAYAQNLRNKRDVFKARTGTRKTVFIVMVTSHGTRENRYYQELVDGQLTAERLFAP